MSIHRFIPASFKHGNKTACGIRLVSDARTAGGMTTHDADTADGSIVSVTLKGQPFDCERCRSVLERFHTKDMRL